MSTVTWRSVAHLLYFCLKTEYPVSQKAARLLRHRRQHRRFLLIRRSRGRG